MTTPLRILVVEDDDALRELYVELLAGHDVATAADGREALREIQRDFDLVITDLNMPNVSGADFLRELRERGHPPDMPVLVITSFPRDLPSSLAGPRTTVLRKPFELDAFAVYVDAVAADAGERRPSDA